MIPPRANAQWWGAVRNARAALLAAAEFHAAEFQHAENAAIQADAILHKKDRARLVILMASAIANMAGRVKIRNTRENITSTGFQSALAKAGELSIYWLFFKLNNAFTCAVTATVWGVNSSLGAGVAAAIARAAIGRGKIGRCGS